MNHRRVVVTGLGIIAPNAHGIQDFEKALREGKSGIRFLPHLEKLKFGCRVGGIPDNLDQISEEYFPADILHVLNESMRYAGIAAIDAWTDAGMQIPLPDDDRVNWDSGAIVGTGIGGADTLGIIIPKVNEGRARRLGSAVVEQTMSSSVSARLSGLLALGNQVTTNSSACSTGTEAVIMGYERIREGKADKMLCGGAEGSSPYIWAGFDAMRVLNTGKNEVPEQASRPMSATAGGFIPGAGAGILLLESLDSAQQRGARIYGEILGGAVNSGGQRNGGSMSAPNGEGVQRCIRAALHHAGIGPGDVDVINGHLTATMADPLELANWAAALERTPVDLPYIHSTKSLVGHCLGAAGGIECVASLLEVHKGFIHGSINCEDLHEKILPYEKRVVHDTIEKDFNILIKASFGFGDVNSCVVFQKYEG
ncbi:beta-ketoacyl-[acyl-carrier-protein] synthase family protein [Fidelibacter multiformis]|uniref:beta-ketoacyl-[acyl-carrier-protein] synthase family protein n=1 Tax=Fidelibacter multiformis TaxID=3377529 RepID=UPI0037DC8552